MLFLIHFLTFASYCQEIKDEDQKVFTVVIDPGHGGKDPGAKGKFSLEKDLALAISLKAGKYIEEKIPEIKVIYTRKTDIFPALHERAKIANDADADLFLSIHVNSNPKSSPYGTSSHVLGLHRMGENFDVAKRENSVILLEDDYETRYENFDPNSPESYIMFSLMQNVYFDQSLYFSQMMQNQFRERAKRKDRGVKQQGLLVLAQTSMPGVLIETGFISNPKEEKYLMSEQGQDYLASAIYRAVKDYKAYIESVSTDHLPLTSLAKPDKTETSGIEGITRLPAPDSINEEKALPITNSQKNLKSVKPVSDPKNSTVTFKVQIIYSEHRIDLSNDIFKDFNDVEEINASGKYKYVVGSKESYDEAIEFSKWVKSRHPDAFVVAVSEGRIIPISEALKHENTN